MVAPAESRSLSLRGVHKVFHASDGTRLSALDNVSFSVDAGDFVALVGPSGCGKSTVLRLAAGLEAPDAGTLLEGDAPIAGTSRHRGLVFQDPSLFPWLNVRHNIQTGLVARGVLHQQRHDADELIKLVGLEAFAKSYPHQLSGGMAQRAALARALVNHPQILLLDEPLGALDAFTRMRLQDEILRLWQTRGTTMLLVTHDIDEALYMANRILLMSPRPGRIESEFPNHLPRPRSRTSPEFLHLRTQILGALHLRA